MSGTTPPPPPPPPPSDAYPPPQDAYSPPPPQAGRPLPPPPGAQPPVGAPPSTWSTPTTPPPIGPGFGVGATTGPEHGTVGLALVGGVAGAFVAGLVWWGIVATTRTQITFVAIGVGWVVAQAVLICCQQRNRLPLQAIAGAFTLLSLAASEYFIQRTLFIKEYGDRFDGFAVPPVGRLRQRPRDRPGGPEGRPADRAVLDRRRRHRHRRGRLARGDHPTGLIGR